MKLNALSSFAAGILITTSICGAVYFSGDHGASKASGKSVKVNLTENEMKEKLSAAGYVIETKADYDNKTQSAKASTSTPKPATAPAPAKKQDTPKTTDVVVNVTDGMTSIDVGRALQSAKVISNAFEFSKEIEKKGLQNKLKPGSYTVHPGMLYDQIISTFFK